VREGRPNRIKNSRVYKQAELFLFQRLACPCIFARFSAVGCSTVEYGMLRSLALLTTYQIDLSQTNSGSF